MHKQKLTIYSNKKKVCRFLTGINMHAIIDSHQFANLNGFTMFSTKTLTVFLLAVFVSKSIQVTVDCEFTIIKRWKVVTNSYGCLIDTLDIKSKLTVTNATGTHVQGKTNSDVKALKIADRCEVIPSGFSTIFPNIEALSIWKAGLLSVSSTDLKEFVNLREIMLFVNTLEYLESKLFQYNPKIESINFSSNNIKYIGGTFFNYLPNLKKAFFIYNNCVKGQATDPAELNALKDEIKEKCAVDEPTNSLEISVDCQYKSSPGWKVVENPYGCFLTTLDIKTKLTVTKTTGKHLAGKSNNDVKALNINGGVSTIFPSAIGTIFPNIEVLSVWNASLKLIASRDLQQFSNLRECWLNANDLNYLESDLFEYNPKVEVIVFKNNQIKFIGANFFSYLPKLRKADFRHNDCIDGEATDIATLNTIKDEIKGKCSVLAKELKGFTTIRKYKRMLLYTRHILTKIVCQILTSMCAFARL